MEVMMKNNKQEPSKKLTIIAVVAVAIVLIGVGVYLWIIPHYNLSINNVANQTSSNADGVKQLTAELDVDCNITESGDKLNCERRTIEGAFNSNRDVTVSVSEGADNLKTDGGKISFEPEIVSVQSVVVRPEPIKDPISKQYKITMTNTDTNKVVAIYDLTVRTTFTDSDIKIVNKEPTAEAIKTAVAKIDTIQDVCIADEDTDPNGKLGKDGTYYIKVIFRDSRSTHDNLVYDESTGTPHQANNVCEVGNEAGGSVEVFRNSEDAKSRKEYLDDLAGGFFDSGSSKLVNSTIIRTSSEMKASEQKDLEQKLVNVLTQ